MRVMVRRVEDGVSEITVVPGRARRMVPITSRGTDAKQVYDDAVAVFTLIKEEKPLSTTS